MIVSLKNYVTREGDGVVNEKELQQQIKFQMKVNFLGGCLNFRFFVKSSSGNRFDLKLSNFDILNGLVIILLKG